MSNQEMNKVNDIENAATPDKNPEKQQKYKGWIDEEEPPYTCADRITSKDFVSNCLTFLVMIIGIILRSQQDDIEDRETVGAYLLAFGVFGFAGGITNWLAVKMLFDDVPLIYGSGVIPNRFREIRSAIKKMLMRTFFDEAYLKKYLSTKMTKILEDLKLEEKLKDFINTQEFEVILKGECEKILKSPQGMMIGMVCGGSADGLAKMVKPMTGSMVGFATPLITKSMQSDELVNIPKIRGQINEMLEEKLLELTPEIVKKMMEDVMRKHLGWLVVWGNVFGSCIGIIAHVCTVFIGIP